ncbi:CD225/dispanin family protein [Allomuricauda sp. SCSIO 65647]|uniref:CD225/dispanin family protein n=1 Tax=Allomuricauda sp. SCSIO 65647 TaxID=2908843 RepID=UPI001F3EE12C|nr:CD225/dispanin family protein [Muricauda sp. SCSIO 65647]UJH66870.1 CD225/dispanin family protein [Muricauda sp. SCSIO 65647]
MQQRDNHRPKPNDYLALAIISTILCCPPTGIVSIIYATKVSDAYYRGAYEEAERASKSAKLWGLAGIILPLAFFMLYIILEIILGLAFLGLFFGAIFAGGENVQ